MKAYFWAGKGVFDLIRPTALKSCENVLFRNVLHTSFIVIFWVIGENDADNFILCSTQPAFF